MGNNNITNFLGASLLLSIGDNCKLPPELFEFLKKDDQGIEGLEFMLRNPKLNRRIPQDVRIAYEVLYATLKNEIETSINKTIKQLHGLLNDPKSLKDDIHYIIQEMYEKEKEKK